MQELGRPGGVLPALPLVYSHLIDNQLVFMVPSSPELHNGDFCHLEDVCNQENPTNSYLQHLSHTVLMLYPPTFFSIMAS